MKVDWSETRKQTWLTHEWTGVLPVTVDTCFRHRDMEVDTKTGQGLMHERGQIRDMKAGMADMTADKADA